VYVGVEALHYFNESTRMGGSDLTSCSMFVVVGLFIGGIVAYAKWQNRYCAMADLQLVLVWFYYGSYLALFLKFFHDSYVKKRHAKLA
jgi:hypothetical protein